MWIFELLHFLWFCIAILSLFYINAVFGKPFYFIHFIVPPKLLKLQRLTIPHFKALDKLFWPLAWFLTVGAITFVILSKMLVLFFFTHTLLCSPLLPAPIANRHKAAFCYCRPRARGASSWESRVNSLEGHKRDLGPNFSHLRNSGDHYNRKSMHGWVIPLISWQQIYE